MLTYVVVLIGGVLIGAAGAYAWRAILISTVQGENVLLRERLVLVGQEAEKRHAETSQHYERIVSEHRLQREEVQTAFKAAAVDALQKSADMYRASAEQDLKLLKTETTGELEKGKSAIESAVRELRGQLVQAGEKIALFEKERVEQYSKVQERLQNLHDNETKLVRQTDQLRAALSTSGGVRGQWGEAVLENLLRDAGLVPGVDFETQVVSVSEDGVRLRPDVVITLPATGRKLIIDAKTSLFEDLQVSERELSDEERQELHRVFAGKIRARATELAGKSYAESVESALPFVLMFVPSEAGIRAAFDADRDLFHWAMQRRVMLASPATVLPLLLLIAQMREQVNLSENTQRLGTVVEELGRRLTRFFGHLAKVQRGLRMATDGWNEAVAKSWHGRQSIPRTLERVRDLGGAIAEVEDEPEVLTQPLLQDDESDDDRRRVEASRQATQSLLKEDAVNNPGPLLNG